MSDFLQIHILTALPPSNVNRDDTGRPKTALVGGVTRLRISSQALKRAWRTSAVFAQHVGERVGTRTQKLGDKLLEHLAEKGIAADAAKTIARQIAGVFGKVKPVADPNPTRIEQLAFVGPEEWQAAFDLADRAAAGEKIDPKVDDILLQADTAADIALFGRMFADAPEFNREAAVQVAHAITTHGVTVEDDFYTALDDLKRPSEDMGASFVGELGFSSGVFYQYLCVDRALLLRNLGGNARLASDAIAGLVEAALTVVPRGKQASFAALSRASFALAERGTSQPRSLVGAFIAPVDPRMSNDVVQTSIQALDTHHARLERAYGSAAEHSYRLDVDAEIGTLADLVTFAAA